ncbi:helix-turn-helix transcriptional regulator [Streptococcus acidominimus]|uniref:XRE family transcriptional regulator n=1 Tax=Streptococcus acidominimus TaxID=1326 RepID=A0A4Y9FRH9_STRAI|nr:helix-turn-helix transcriptional regulator [Streptococcus acidominimus]MBF0818712.1 helix-turn-helix transcriptional regulator [Streptococcus acidominimus]MBF0838345.1 helix-turn-helix transcriptional regulator [Streptococcus acidominimus]MBF0848937.1 helix-turn-helix transcriptional regulator [Streptococcus danieliae]TFU30879.1 XRE family transcriptional regulator [Streptococcus acidominimus]
MQILLYELRKEANLTQSDLADKLGISDTAYRQKEKGQRPFTQDEMFFLGKFFNKPIQEIFLPRKSPNRKLLSV